MSQTALPSLSRPTPHLLRTLSSPCHSKCPLAFASALASALAPIPARALALALSLALTLALTRFGWLTSVQVCVDRSLEFVAKECSQQAPGAEVCIHPPRPLSHPICTFLSAVVTRPSIAEIAPPHPSLRLLSQLSCGTEQFHRFRHGQEVPWFHGAEPQINEAEPRFHAAEPWFHEMDVESGPEDAQRSM